jgi:hypothetical protein
MLGRGQTKEDPLLQPSKSTVLAIVLIFFLKPHCHWLYYHSLIDNCGISGRTWWPSGKEHNSCLCGQPIAESLYHQGHSRVGDLSQVPSFSNFSPDSEMEAVLPSEGPWSADRNHAPSSDPILMLSLECLPGVWPPTQLILGGQCLKAPWG